MVSIEINSHLFQMKFGIGALRILASAWNCKGIQSVATKFQDIFPEDGEEDMDLSFDQVDQIGDLILAGIQNAYPKEVIKLDRDEVMDQVMFDSEKLNMVMTAFAQSFPQSGNHQPQKTLGKKARKPRQK